MPIVDSTVNIDFYIRGDKYILVIQNDKNIPVTFSRGTQNVHTCAPCWILSLPHGAAGAVLVDRAAHFVATLFRCQHWKINCFFSFEIDVEKLLY